MRLAFHVSNNIHLELIFTDDVCECILFKQDRFVLGSNVTEGCNYGFNEKEVSTGACNGLVPNGRQSII